MLPQSAAAEEATTAALFVTVNGPADKLPEAEVQAFEDALRAVASGSLRPLGYQIMDQKALTSALGASVTARTGCDEACRFGPTRKLPSRYGVGIVDAEVTAAAAYTVRIRFLEPATQVVLMTTTIEASTLAALQAQLADKLGTAFTQSTLPTKRTWTPNVARALEVGDMAPSLTLKPDAGPSLALAKPDKELPWLGATSGRRGPSDPT